MSAATLALLLQLLESAIADAPAFIADVEALVNAIKGGTTTVNPSFPPIAPGIANDPLVGELETPVAKPVAPASK